MSYTRTTLLAEEKIILFSRPHFVVFSQAILWLLLTIVLFHFGSVYRMLSILSFIMTIFEGLQAYLFYTFSEYVITNKRIIMKVGFISRRSLEIFMHRIEGIYVEQSIFGRAFNYGTVIIGGIGGSQDPFYYIPDPLTFRNIAQEQLEKATKLI